MSRFVAVVLLLNAVFHAAAFAVALPVKIVPGKGITRGDGPYFVKGAGGEKHLDELVAAGGNSIRTWTTNGLDEILEQASKRGLTVCAGIWLEPECNWFSYGNPKHCAKQIARVVSEVVKHRDHPALLFWGLGNEAEATGRTTLTGSSSRCWRWW
jgi:beta-galactosidase/beta-glucuronidase